MSNQQHYRYESDYDLGPMFDRAEREEHRRRNREKFTGQAKSGGSWIQNNPLPVLIAAFIALTALCTATDKSSSSSPSNEVPKAEVQQASIGKQVAQAITGTPAEAATTSTTAVNNPQPFIARNECEAEMMKVFPQNLWAEARVTLETENRQGLPGLKIPNKNKQGVIVSYDHGCFMVNDDAQLNNPNSKWLCYDCIFNANYNARVAKHIYESNGGTWKAWYGPCTKGKEKLPLARCGR